jgi:hypothetical protein
MCYAFVVYRPRLYDFRSSDTSVYGTVRARSKGLKVCDGGVAEAPATY